MSNSLHQMCRETARVSMQEATFQATMKKLLPPRCRPLLPRKRPPTHLLQDLLSRFKVLMNYLHTESIESSIVLVFEASFATQSSVQKVSVIGYFCCHLNNHNSPKSHCFGPVQGCNERFADRMDHHCGHVGLWSTFCVMNIGSWGEFCWQFWLSHEQPCWPHSPKTHWF